jgi:hypothetical protein
MNRYQRRRFTVRYRIEKWWFEDSKEDIKKALSNLGGIVLCGLMLGALFILPAMLH